MIEKLKVEYLISIIGNENFCNSKNTFDNLIQSNSNIRINKNDIKYKNINIKYTNQYFYINEENRKVFHVILEFNDMESIEIFEKFLREFREILLKVTDDIQVLFDEISTFYAIKAYPLINRIENIMRKLLTKFMVIKIGSGWDKNYAPTDIKKVINEKKAEYMYNYLHKTDFIQLSSFLFDKYQIISAENFIRKLSNGQEIEKDTIQDFIPKSNWERYFNSIVNCEDEFLKKRWNKLYELRCQIAHNTKFDKNDYENVVRLIREVEPKLVEAINKLEQVEIQEDEKENLAENIISNINVLFAEYLMEFRNFEIIIRKYVELVGLNVSDRTSLREKIEGLYKNGYIKNDMKEKIMLINNFRNKMVHTSNEIIDNSKILYNIDLLKNINNEIIKDIEVYYNNDESAVTD